MPSPLLLDGWSNPDRFAVWLAVLMTVFAVVVRRLPRAPLLVGTAMVLVLAGVAACSLQFDLVGWHGFMHGAPIFRMIDGGGVPPEDPLFAGGALRYPWAQQWLIARLAGLTGISAHLMEIGIEIGLFAVFLAAAARLASLVTRDPEVIALAVLFAGFGVSAFHGGILLDVVHRALPWLSLENRAVPLDKFASITAMPGGYAAMFVAAAAATSAVTGRMGSVSAAAWVAAGVLAAALLHPLSWAGLLVFLAATGVVLLPGFRSEDLRRLRWLAVAAMAASLVALPYLNAVGVSESSDGWSGLTSPPSLLATKAWDLLLFLAPLLLLVYVGRDRLLQMLEDGNRALQVLVAAIVAFALAYLVLRFPGRNEYKFLLFLAPCAAVLFAIALRGVLERHLLLGMLVMFATLLPGGRALGERPWFVATDVCRPDGPYLRSTTPTDDKLYQWVARQTPADAVFIAADLRMPALGRRPLYIAVDAPWRGRDGWGVTRNNLLQWHVRRPDAQMYYRQHLATLMLDANWSKTPAEKVIAAINADLGGRPLFVHETNAAAAARLDSTPGFELLFRNASGSVYAVLQRSSPQQPQRSASQQLQRSDFEQLQRSGSEQLQRSDSEEEVRP